MHKSFMMCNGFKEVHKYISVRKTVCGLANMESLCPTRLLNIRSSPRVRSGREIVRRLGLDLTARRIDGDHRPLLSLGINSEVSIKLRRLYH